jgi:Zn-dependent protease
VTLTAAAEACASCGAEVASGLLACPGCARLVFAHELARLAEEAEAAERAGDLTGALTAWRRAVQLLPPGTRQGASIQTRMSDLTAAIDGRGPRPPGVNDAADTGGREGVAGGARTRRRAGALGVIGVALLKSKALLLALLANGKLLLLGLLKLPTLLSALLYLRFSGGGGRVGYALGIVACIYVHEMGHVAALKRYGIEASAPMFIPGFGALVRLKQYPTDAHEDARTGLAGPLWGLVAAAVSALIGRAGGSALALAIGSIAARINLFNLIAVWQLDGSRGLRALSRSERLVVAAVAALVGFALHQWLPILVAIPAAARAFSADAHPTGDRRILASFVGLIVTLGALSMLPM